MKFQSVTFLKIMMAKCDSTRFTINLNIDQDHKQVELDHSGAKCHLVEYSWSKKSRIEKIKRNKSASEKDIKNTKS